MFCVSFFLSLSKRTFPTLLLAVTIFFNATAQESRVLVEVSKESVAGKPSILLKWYSKDLVYPEGVNVYRRQEGSLNWSKLNDRPIARKQSVAKSLLDADPDLNTFVEMVKSGQPADLQQEMVFFNLLIKSFQSNPFADFLGIYFEDRTATMGTIYEYRVNKINKGREFLVAVSRPITATSFSPGAPIDSIEIFQKGKAISFNWKQEEERFYAVNIYRKISSDQTITRLNKNPIMLTQVTDSAGNLGYAKPMFTESRQLEEGKDYTYQLAGVGFFGNETQWSKPQRVSFKDITPPPAPKNLTGKADSMKVHIRWENVASPDLKSLRVYRSRRSDGPFDVANARELSTESTYYHDSLLIPGPYYYFAAAVDSVGNEAHSDMLFLEVQDVIPPAQPTQFTLVADTGRIHLSWKEGIEPDLAGYYIYRTVDGNRKNNYVLLNAEPIKGNHFEQNLPKNVKNKFYYYIVAVDTSYNRSKPSEFAYGAMPDVLAPERPFIKGVSYNGDDILVEWVPNVEADLEGYHVFRADTSKRFVQVNVNLLGRNTFRFTDRNNEPNTDYYYYVVARDSAGNLSAPSKERYARRIAPMTMADGQLNLRAKFNRRTHAGKLVWTYSSSEPVLGFVVFRGETKDRLQPITGLIQAKNFPDKSKRKSNVLYQVRAYVGDRVIYSNVVGE